MLRAKLLAATAVATLMAAPALAQETTSPAPPAPTETTAPAETATAAAPAASGSVIDVLKSSGQFTTLLSALDQAQLTETLQSRPAISIFAPTDAAFAALPEAERTRLMDPANANELRQVLLYHVIVADVTPDQIEGRKGGVPTASEAQILLDGTGEAIKADAATVVSAELDASNGAVFPIDQVLNPAQSMAAMGDEEAAAEAAPADEATPAETTETDAAAPAATETTAPETTTPVPTTPSGAPAAVTTTTASPPVPNPTDGQVDDPSTTPPVDAADPAADGGEETDPTPQ